MTRVYSLQEGSCASHWAPALCCPHLEVLIHLVIAHFMPPYLDTLSTDSPPCKSTRPGPGWVGSGRNPPGMWWLALPGSSVASPEEARNALWSSLTQEGGSRGEPQPGWVGPQLGLGRWWSGVCENCNYLTSIHVSPTAPPAASGTLDVLWVSPNPKPGGWE